LDLCCAAEILADAALGYFFFDLRCLCGFGIWSLWLS